MNMLVETRISMKLRCGCGEYTEFDFECFGCCSSFSFSSSMIRVICRSWIQHEISVLTPLILTIRYVLEIKLETVIFSCSLK